MRIASFDIANDSVLSARLKSLVDTVDSITNPYSTWLPWLPGPALFHKFFASVQIYRIVQAAINARKRSGIKRDDILQQMIDEGDGTIQIFGVCILATFPFTLFRDLTLFKVYARALTGWSSCHRNNRYV
jgi:sterol 14-demethylase